MNTPRRPKAALALLFSLLLTTLPAFPPASAATPAGDAGSAELDLTHPGFYDYYRQQQAQIEEITGGSDFFNDYY